MENLFEYYMTEDQLLEEEKMLLEGRLRDFFGSLKNKFLAKVVKDKFEKVQALPQITPKQRQMAATATQMLPIDQIVELTDDIDVLKQRGLLNDLNKRLIEVFGGWWKDHLITQDDFQRAIAEYQKEHGKVAMPVKKF